jgi:hypothetical protein
MNRGAALVGFWDKVGDAADKSLTVTNLMQMSESSGVIHLKTLVPRIEDEGWLGDFLFDLTQLMGNKHLSNENREIARMFYFHAREIARR